MALLCRRSCDEKSRVTKGFCPSSCFNALNAGLPASSCAYLFLKSSHRAIGSEWNHWRKVADGAMSLSHRL